MPLSTYVSVRFTPIRRNSPLLQTAGMIAAIQGNLNARASRLIVDAKGGYASSKPLHYVRTYKLRDHWKKQIDGVGVRVYNDVQGTNWSGEQSRYAQFVYGTITDPDRQGPWQEDWPLFYDLVNQHFSGAAADRSSAMSKFMQNIMNRYFN